MLSKKKAFAKEIKTKLHLRRVGQMTEETLLLRAFKYFDMNNSGRCGPSEFMKSLIKVGINSVNEENLKEYFSLFDTDKDGLINYKEFIESIFNEDTSGKEANAPQLEASPKKSDKAKHQMISQNKELLLKVVESLKKRGTGSIIHLARTFKVMDKDNSKTINKEEFTRAAKSYNFDLTDEEINTVFVCFDHNDDGVLDYDEFLRVIRGSLNSFRKALVQQAFNILDTTKNGIIELDEVKAKYNVGMHPDMLSGKKTQDEIYQEFIDSFQQHHNIMRGVEKDNKITLEEFIDYYESISMYIDDDAYFETMMNNAWRMNDSTTYKNDKKGWASKEKEGKKMQDAFNEKFPNKERDILLEKLRKLLASKGIRGVVNLVRLFYRINDNNSLGADMEEFITILVEATRNDKSIELGNSLSTKEIQTLFTFFDIHDTGIIHYPTFISSIHGGKMNDVRHKAVSDVFDKLDTEKKGGIELRELKTYFNAPNPNPMPDQFESLEIYHNTLRGSRNPIITKEEFISFYDLISFLIPSDNSFISIITSSWDNQGNKIPKIRVKQPELGRQKDHRLFFDFHKKKAPYGVDQDKTNYITSYAPDVNKVYETPFEEIMNKLRARIKARGVRGIMMLRRTFMLIDENNSKTIDFKEFGKFITRFRLKISPKESQEIFNHFDKDNSGGIDYQEFTNIIIGDISDKRVKVLQRVFKKIDKDNKGYITVNEIRQGFNPKDSPSVREGKKNEEEVLGDFIDLIEYYFNLLDDVERKRDDKGDIIVPFDEFVNFYKNISLGIDDDKLFEVKLASEWGLDLDGKSPYQRGWKFNE